MSATQRLAGQIEAHGSVKPGTEKKQYCLGIGAALLLSRGYAVELLLKQLSIISYGNTNRDAMKMRHCDEQNNKYVWKCFVLTSEHVRTCAATRAQAEEITANYFLLPLRLVKPAGLPGWMHNNKQSSLDSGRCARIVFSEPAVATHLHSSILKGW